MIIFEEVKTEAKEVYCIFCKGQILQGNPYKLRVLKTKEERALYPLGCECVYRIASLLRFLGIRYKYIPRKPPKPLIPCYNYIVCAKTILYAQKGNRMLKFLWGRQK